MRMISVLDLLGKLPKEHQVALKNAIIMQMIGQSNEDIVIRKTFTISTLATNEQLQKQIAEAMNVPIESLSGLNITSEISKLNERYNQTEEFIKEYKDFLSRNNSQKGKYQELSDIGKFILVLNEGHKFEIPSMPLDFPDFVVQSDDARIGIEHTRLLSSYTKKNREFVRSILGRVKNELSSRNSSYSGLINVEIDFSKEVISGKNFATSKFTSREVKQIVGILTEHFEMLLNHVTVKLPSYINSASINNGDTHLLDIILVESYIGLTDFKDLLTKTIEAKEKRFPSYASSNNFQELWLVIVIDGTSSSSYVLNYDNLNEATITSNFDRIYLFDSFLRQLYMLNISK